MPLAVRRFAGGPIETNAYLVADTSTGDAIVIDAPQGVADQIVTAVNEMGATVHQIVITHGHWDHITEARTLSEAVQAPIFGHAGVRERLTEPVAGATPVPVEPAQMAGELDEQDEVTVGGHCFSVFYMPGHDPAHIVLYSEDDAIIFGGDVLFPGGHGRTDIPGSDQVTMNATLRRFLAFAGQVRVYPGHGESTTLEAEQGWIQRIPE